MAVKWHSGLMADHPMPPGQPALDAAPDAALDAALNRIGDRWSLLVVAALLDGPRRFGELESAVSGIATNVLTQRLRALESGGIVVARPYSRRPLRSAYQLTSTGRDLAGALRLLSQWGADAAGPGSGLAAPAHQACGTPLEARWWCPTCDQPADGENEEGPLLWV
jgi:DNA-binding HxlR family transcriptional regulator